MVNRSCIDFRVRQKSVKSGKGTSTKSILEDLDYKKVRKEYILDKETIMKKEFEKFSTLTRTIGKISATNPYIKYFY